MSSLDAPLHSQFLTPDPQQGCRRRSFVIEFTVGRDRAKGAGPVIARKSECISWHGTSTHTGDVIDSAPVAHLVDHALVPLTDAIDGRHHAGDEPPPDRTRLIGLALDAIRP